MKLEEKIFENTKLHLYLRVYGTQITSDVLKMVNSLDGLSSYSFYKDFSFFYYLFPKINFFNKEIVKECFMDEFDKNNKEYKRIEKMFEFLSSSLCGIRKKFDDVYFILCKFMEDLEGFDRTGEYYEIPKIFR